MAARFAEVIQAIVHQNRRRKAALQQQSTLGPGDSSCTLEDRDSECSSSGQLLLEAGATDCDAAAYIRYMRWQRALRSATRLGRGLLASSDRHSGRIIPLGHSPDPGCTPVGSPDIGPPPLLEGCRALLLRTEHWLEVADPRHRYGSNLRPYFDYWVTETSSSNLSKGSMHRKTAHAAPSRMQTVTGGGLGACAGGKPPKAPAASVEHSSTTSDGGTPLQCQSQADQHEVDTHARQAAAPSAHPQHISYSVTAAPVKPRPVQPQPAAQRTAAQHDTASSTLTLASPSIQSAAQTSAEPCQPGSCCKLQDAHSQVPPVETRHSPSSCTADAHLPGSCSPTPSGPDSRGWLGPSHCASAPQLFLEGEEAEVACMSPMMCLTAVGSGSEHDCQALTDDLHVPGDCQQQPDPHHRQPDECEVQPASSLVQSAASKHTPIISPFKALSQPASVHLQDTALQEGGGTGLAGHTGRDQPACSPRDTGSSSSCVRRSQELHRKHRQTVSQEDMQFDGEEFSVPACSQDRQQQQQLGDGSGGSSPRRSSPAGRQGEVCATPRRLSMCCEEESAWQDKVMSVPHVIRSQSLLAAKQNARVHRSCGDLQQLSEPLNGYADVNQSRDNFFRWLDYGDGTLVDLSASGGPSRTKLDTEIVMYLTPQQLEHYEVVVDKATGKLVYKLSGEVLHTGPPPSQVARRHTHSLPGNMTTPGMMTATMPALHQHHHHQEQQQEQEGGAQQARDQVSTSQSGAGRDGGPVGAQSKVPGRVQSEPSPICLPATSTAAVQVNSFQAGAGTQADVGAAAGLRCDSHSRAPGQFSDTVEKTPKWIYVVDVEGRLYVEAKVRGHFHHSSFLRGGAVLAAGALVVDEGRLVALTADSGHYHPKPTHFQWFFHHLRSQGADLSGLQGIQFRTKH